MLLAIFAAAEFKYMSMKILMVCLGNICRSPIAEGVMKHKIQEAGLNWTVESAGTSGHQVGCAPHKLSQKITLLNGIDISRQSCRQLYKEDILNYDKIYALDKENYYDIKRISGDLWDASKVDLLMNAVYPGKNIEVPDPWFGTEKNYHEVYAMIDKACDAIVEKASPSLPNNRDRLSGGGDVKTSKIFNRDTISGVSNNLFPTGKVEGGPGL